MLNAPSVRLVNKSFYGSRKKREMRQRDKGILFVETKCRIAVLNTPMSDQPQNKETRRIQKPPKIA